jgi:hypothetical protein
MPRPARCWRTRSKDLIPISNSSGLTRVTAFSGITDQPSKSGNNRLTSAQACGQRPSGGALQSWPSSRALQPRVGWPGVFCGYTSSSTEQVEHSIVVNLVACFISPTPRGKTPALGLFPRQCHPGAGFPGYELRTSSRRPAAWHLSQEQGNRGGCPSSGAARQLQRAEIIARPHPLYRSGFGRPVDNRLCTLPLRQDGAATRSQSHRELAAPLLPFRGKCGRDCSATAYASRPLPNYVGRGLGREIPLTLVPTWDVGEDKVAGRASNVCQIHG